ncbi:hypothetical protein [Microvirus mar41]|uniref:Uncharacterized protein n=2 Tax=unclassified Microviridae TaxID=117574 RepID=A0A8F5RBU3_9VIRU|nr:hypothetical protein [Microvirus mar41]QXN75206.1 hypothetical protein [Microvirus mar42]
MNRLRWNNFLLFCLLRNVSFIFLVVSSFPVFWMVRLLMMLSLPILMVILVTLILRLNMIRIAISVWINLTLLRKAIKLSMHTIQLPAALKIIQLKRKSSLSLDNICYVRGRIRKDAEFLNEIRSI